MSIPLSLHPIRSNYCLVNGNIGYPSSFSGLMYYALRVILALVFLCLSLPSITQSYTISQSGVYDTESVSPIVVSAAPNGLATVPIGFSFSFFGTSYTQCYVGQNGFVAFDTDGNGLCCGQPLPVGAEPNNLIAAAWTDQTVSSLRYELFGAAPFRRLVITLDLGDGCTTYYGQVKLFESTNVIEIHTQNWAASNSPCGNTTQGLENADGTEGIPVPGRNYNATWSVTPAQQDFVSFAPAEIYIVDHSSAYAPEFNLPNDISIFDNESVSVPIGFPFTFFGGTYTSCHVADNGFIAFGSDPVSGCCEGQSIPDPDSPNNLIAAAWMNAGSSNCCQGGNSFNVYQYETIGTAPNRRFLVTMYMYEVNGIYYYGQIKLYEGSNIIEIHTSSWGEFTDPQNNVTQGIENSNGAQAFYYPGRNANTSWSVPCCDNDVVRFTPASSLPQNDAAVEFLADEVFCVGPQMISVYIHNPGGDPIETVDVEWTWDGVAQTPVTFDDPMPVADLYYLVDLGAKNLVFGQDYDLKAWTSMPDGMPDDNPGNDTLTATIDVSLLGSYTIGGVSPNYPTITAAINALQSLGICDTVTMLVRPGTYTEQLVIPYIPGTELYPVIFTAENGDSSSVVLQYTSTLAASNYVLRFQDARNITWEKMTINALGTSYARIIELIGNSPNNTIRNCALTGRNTTSGSSNFTIIRSTELNHNTIIEGNTIRYGSYGLLHDFSWNYEYSQGWQIIGNRFLDYSFIGFETENTVGLQVHHNSMESAKNFTYGFQIFTDSSFLSVSHNQIYLPIGDAGMNFYDINYDNGKGAEVFNNVINLPKVTSSPKGMSMYDCHDMNIFQNTIRISNISANAYAFYHSDCDRDTVYNNIFSNAGGGPAIFLEVYQPVAYDHNAYHVTGTLFGRFETTNATNFASWKALSHQDDHSFATNPFFVSATNLHVQSSFLNASGSPLFVSQVDMDGENRNMVTPDIGADEFTPPPIDAGITSVLSPTVNCNAEQDIKIVLTNFGADTLEEVTIAWKINGVTQTPLLYNQPLMAEGDTAHITLSSFVFSEATETFKFWTSMPNNSIDAQQSNDTISLVYRLPLSGTYTIGGASPHFANMTAAVDAMENFTICGPVIFKFRNAVYTGQVEIDSIGGVSPVNTITFESESGDSTTVELAATGLSSTKNYLILVSKTDYITFRNMRFRTSGNTTYSTILSFVDGAHHITIEGNSFVGRVNATQGNLILYAGSAENEYYTIRNNYFRHGTVAISATGLGNSILSRDLVIENNTFRNQRNAAMRIFNHKHFRAADNTILKDISNISGSPIIGIDISFVEEENTISGNTVTLSTGGTGFDINFANNTVGDTSNTVVYNNMIYTTNGTGFRLRYGVRTGVYHNSINSQGTLLTNYAFELIGVDAINVRNNIFVTNTGRTISCTSNPPNTISNYNSLFTAGAQIGLWNNITYANLPAWQAGTSLDANSMQINPMFLSPSNLHVLADTLDGAGTPIAGINLDIDEQPRNALSPDIGADEIGTNNNDAGVIALLPEMPFVRGNQDIKAVIRNYGGNTLNSLQVHWKANGVAQSSYSYSGSLPALGQDTIVLGTINFLLSTPYDFKAWSSQPNMTADLYNSNDTTEVIDQYAGVSDTITIGGASPDVTTIQNAINAFTLGGIIDSVHFHIRPGTYNESVVMPQSDFHSCNTPVVFESETGDADDVLWTHLQLAGVPLTIQGADGLTFRNITFQTTSFSHQAVIINNQSDCNTFENCEFIGVVGTSTSASRSLVYSASGTDHQNVFINNTFRDGSTGLWWQGTAVENNTIVAGNSFINQYYRGIYLSNQNAPQVLDNLVQNTSTSSTSYIGTTMSTCSNQFKLAGNTLRLNRGINIYIASSTGTAALPGLTYNNFISNNQTNAVVGIDVYNSSYQKLYHNSIRMSGANAGTWGVYFHNTSNSTLVNNIIYNETGGLALKLANATELTVSNFNDLITTGGQLVQTNLGTYADIEAWQATGKDLNSFSEDPQYLSTTDLHVTSAFLNGTGTPIAAVTTDIDGQLRDIVTPDIGADEFNLFPDDVGILSINYPVQPFPSGENTVFIKFSNNGQDTLTTMQVDWEIDGIPQPTYYWTGLLASAATYDSLDIGSYIFAPYQPHSIKVWISNPNGMTDGLATNDTLYADDLYTGLLGTYTIGGVDPDFDSIAQAITALNLGGAAGDVIFNIRSGTYLETLDITAYAGSDCDRSVTFKSETNDSTDVIITNLGINDNTLTLDGADGVIFRHLTIQSVNPAFRNVIQYLNGAHCNQFLNNAIIGYTGSSSSSAQAVILSATGLDTANVFSHNLIRNGSYSFYLTGNTSANSNTLIEQNQLEESFQYGIFASAESGIRIKNNIVLPGTNATRGIHLESCHNAIQITGNKVNLTNDLYGIDVLSSNASMSNPGLMVNNFVSVGGTGSAYGIYMNDCDHQRIWHNSIHVHSTTTSSTNNAGIYLTGNQFLHVINNSVRNSSPGWAVFANTNTSITSDYNNYFATGPYVGQWVGVNQVSLEDWQFASGQDANSLAVNPQFMSSTDLHATNIILNGAGQAIVGITTDIDGDLRGSPPDIGADEFDPAIADDAGVFMYGGPNAPFAAGAQSVYIVVKNFGYDTLQSAAVRWLVNGLEQPVFQWTGTLLAAQCDTVDIGQYVFAPYSDHDLLFWTELPNGVADTSHVNDTLAVNNKYPALSGTYTVGGVLPDFNLFSLLENALNTGGILGNVFFDIRDGTYSTQLVIKDFPRNNYNHEVTFRSASGDSSDVTIVRDFTVSSSINYTVKLLDAHQINFEKITLKSTKGRIIEIANGSSRISIDHCRLIGIAVTNDANSTQHIYSNTTSEDSISITSNRFENGGYGIDLTASAGDKEQDLLVADNHFQNCLSYSANIRYQNGFRISGNTVFNNVTNHSGFYINHSTNAKEITRNDFRMLAGGNYGLIIYNVEGTIGTPCDISNNYILMSGWTGTSVGIFQEDCDYINYYYNTVRLENTGINSIVFKDQSSYDYIAMRNCNFANYSGGLVLHNYWVDLYSSNIVEYCNFFTTGNTLAYVSVNHPDLASLQAASAKYDYCVSAEPLFESQGPDILQAVLNAAATPIAGLTTDIYGDIRNGSTPDIGAKEFTLLEHNIGAKLLQAPATYCGFDNTQPVTIRVQNFGASIETGFNVAYSLDGSGWHVENVGGLTVPLGGYLDYTFSTTEDLSDPGTYTFALYTALSGDQDISNDTIWDIEVQHIPALTMPVTNMIPLNGTIDLEKSVSLSWAPAPNATRYDVYVWEDGNAQPVTPQINNIAQINNLYTQLDYGTTYNWQVIAENVCNQMVASPVQQFSVRELPDLVVDTVVAPLTAFSGQTVEVEWVVKNIGSGESQNAIWSDAVYLSLDATLNTSYDIFLGAVQNLNALNSGISYAHSAELIIPEGAVGNYYVFVQADRYSNVIEESNSNNAERTTILTIITLSPIPDLNVTEVSPPILAFSGELVDVLYTVENAGNGSTGLRTWHDRIQLSSNPFNADGPILKTTPITEEILPDSSYTRNVQVLIPEGIFGEYYLFAHTDALNVIYEFSAENNNKQASDTFEIVLSPPADLVITGIDLPDTISSDTKLYLELSVDNQGAGSTETDYWKDDIFLSPAPVFNNNFNQKIGSGYHSQTVPSLGSYTTNIYVTIPKLIEAEYYTYGYTDVTLREYEFNMEGNNIYSSPQKVFVANPDLILANVQYPDTVDADHTFTSTWDQINQGLGNYENKSVQTRIYVSSNPVLNTTTAALIHQYVAPADTMRSGDTLPKVRQVFMPENMFGDLYLHFFVDATNVIYEGANETNNVFSGVVPVYVNGAPAPDLEVIEIVVPDTITAGLSFSMEYSTKNSGEEAILAQWDDDVYISFNPVWTPANAIKLRDIAQEAQLDTGDTLETSLAVAVSISMPENVYYFYVKTDEANEVYEAAGETNNITRSDPVYLKPVPVVDLKIDTVLFAGTVLMTANAYPVTWKTSIVNGATPVIPSWNDRAYLSTDQALDTLLDIPVGLFVVDGQSNGFGPSNPVTKSGNIQIPNGISGQYYLILVSDHSRLHNDNNRSNNIQFARNLSNQPRPITIQLSPSPDLSITSIHAPVTTIAGQWMQYHYCVTNGGAGSAAGSWRDRVYLSADNTLGTGDVMLSDKPHSNLGIGATYCDTILALIPNYYFGNYVLIAKTDQANHIYEHAAEHNNEIQRSFEVTIAPPSDLEVNTVTVPLNAVAGDLVDIAWLTTNNGSYPASGQFREVVYLSADTIWDVTDPLFGLVDKVGYIPPSHSAASNLVGPVTGVVNGNYYAIVQTDSRDNFNESDETNNYTASVDQMDVDVKTLFLDSLTMDVLHNGRELYYKLHIPPSLDGESLVITLEGDSVNGLNELFARFEGIPSRSEFDYAFDLAFSGFQRLVIPSVEPGTYYIMGYGLSQTGPTQQVELLAKIVPFEIYSIAPNKGVKDTKVTVEIRGIKLKDTERIRLRQSDPWFELVAESVFEFSDNLVYATFDLTGVPVDTYHLDAVKMDSSLAYILNGFNVVETGVADLQFRAFAPGAVPRRGVVVKIEVQFINAGDVDVEGAIAEVSAPYGNLIAFTPQQVRSGLGEPILYIPLQEANGPPGIIRPGGSGTIEVFAWSEPRPTFTVSLKD